MRTFKVLGLAGAAIASQCKDGWTQVVVDAQIFCWKHEGHHFVDEGAGICAGLGARLPLPLNSPMQTQFVKHLEDFGITGHVVLDATDVATEGIWVDSTGRELTWTNWADPEPNNVHGNENYMVANDHVGWKWVDQRAGYHKAEVICEYEVWQVNECEHGWSQFEDENGKRCQYDYLAFNYIDNASVPCANLGATPLAWNDVFVCQKPLLENCKRLVKDREDPWMSFNEPNYGRHGGFSIFDYTKDMHCSHDIITDCDPHTESMSVRISPFSIRGGDYQCSEDYATFSSAGGFYGFGDYGGGQVSPKLCGCIQYQSVITYGASCVFEPRFWHDHIQDNEVRERWHDAFSSQLTTEEDFQDLSKVTAIKFTANTNRLKVELSSNHIRYFGDLQFSWNCVPRQETYEELTSTEISEIPPPSGCDEGWYLLPMHVSPDQQKCYKMFESLEVEGGYDLCSSHGASLPLPESEQELENLNAAMNKMDSRGILLGAVMNEDGNWVDESGNNVSSYMPDQLESANYPYLTYYSVNSYSYLYAASGSSKRNIVCEKATSFADDEPTITYSCESGWSLLPLNAAPEERKCYKDFDRQRIDGANAFCAEINANLPFPENEFEAENLRWTLVEIGVANNSALVLGAILSEALQGQPIDYSGQPVNIDHLSLGQYDTQEYLLLYGENSDFVFGTNFGFTMFNVVCEKDPQLSESSEEPDEQCSAPATYDDFASSINSRIDAVVPLNIFHEKKAARSVRWLQSVVQKTNKQMKRKCIQKVNPTPANLPASILGEDCALGLYSIDDFCNQYDQFLNWAFESCSHPKKNSLNNQLRKRCERIRDFYF